MVAIKDIRRGDEITWDYSTWQDEKDWKMNCNCGSKNCRGIISRFRVLSKNIQRKYIILDVVPAYILGE